MISRRRSPRSAPVWAALFLLLQPVLAMATAPLAGTGWPHHQRPGALAPLKAQAPKWEAPNGEHPRIVYWRLMGRTIGRDFLPARVVLAPAAAPRLLRTRSPGDVATCASDPSCALVHVASGVPLEVGFWLALFERLHGLGVESKAVVAARGYGITSDLMQSQARRFERGLSEDSGVSGLRETLRFRLAPGIDCAAQIKRFAATPSPDTTPAARAGRSLRRRDPDMPQPWIQAMRLGLRPTFDGVLDVELLGLWAGGHPSYRLRLYAEQGAHAWTIGARLDTVALECRASRPIFAREVTDVRYGATLASGGTGEVAVRVAPSPSPRVLARRPKPHGR